MGPASCCRSSERCVGVAGEAFILGVSAGMSSSEQMCVSCQPFTNCCCFGWKCSCLTNYWGSRAELRLYPFDWTGINRTKNSNYCFLDFLGLNLLTGAGATYRWNWPRRNGHLVVIVDDTSQLLLKQYWFFFFTFHQLFKTVLYSHKGRWNQSFSVLTVENLLSLSFKESLRTPWAIWV